ncbi:hypothetical protein [Bythopirellula goksoeyrii]|uniref:Uncharacterized protein n=1 Tax=Bythopirellula goksoeyrii TaxID=1400387 RepID=A0A5B9QEM5_9BACT|nr:hypothetical protein [Bythopirellula goksoeyrii]QEG36090.1 hypothetical protein Pr1d_33990 [Bythopirellula goksoeyrii]
MSDDNAEQLTYEMYAMLAEYETNLLAFGNLLAATHIERFLADELNDAEASLRCTRLLLGVLGDNQEDAK